jgi:hypothetical protein
MATLESFEIERVGGKTHELAATQVCPCCAQGYEGMAAAAAAAAATAAAAAAAAAATNTTILIAHLG